MNLIVTNPIIMILKAILNYFRIRRNYIADAVNKIPPEIKDRYSFYNGRIDNIIYLSYY